MGATNAASKSDVASLQSAVKTLQTKVKSLETTSADDKAMQGIAKNIDYQKLRDNISIGDLSSEVLKSPGAIAESVAQSFSKDSTKMEPIAKALADNQTFAKTMADTLTDSSGKYRSTLRGDKGETGEISTSKDSAKAALYDRKYTLWCADGDVCKVPAGNTRVEAPFIKVNKIQIGDWFLEQHPGGNLHVHRGDVNDWYTSHGTNKVFHGRHLWSERWLASQDWRFQKHDNGNLHIYNGDSWDNWSHAMVPNRGRNHFSNSIQFGDTVFAEGGATDIYPKNGWMLVHDQVHAVDNFKSQKWNKWL